MLARLRGFAASSRLARLCSVDEVSGAARIKKPKARTVTSRTEEDTSFMRRGKEIVTKSRQRRGREPAEQKCPRISQRALRALRSNVARAGACIDGGPRPQAASEVELPGELEQAPAHDRNGIQPCRSVAGRHVENIADVEYVIHVGIPLHPDVPEMEDARKAEVDLLDPFFISAFVGNHVDLDGRRTNSGAAARRQVPAEQWRNLRVGKHPARPDREPGNILIDCTGLEVPW